MRNVVHFLHWFSASMVAVGTQIIYANIPETPLRWVVLLIGMIVFNFIFWHKREW